MIRAALLGALVSLSAVAQAAIPEWIPRAIEYGEHYKSIPDLWKHDDGAHTIKVNGIWHGSGSKQVIVNTPFMQVASRAALRKSQMDHLTPEAAADMHAMTAITLIVGGIGSAGMREIAGRFGGTNAIIVLDFGGELVRPVADTGSAGGLSGGIGTYQVTRLGNAVIANQTGDFRSASLMRRFTFDLTPAQLSSAAQLVIIDAHGDKYRKAIDFGKIR